LTAKQAEKRQKQPILKPAFRLTRLYQTFEGVKVGKIAWDTPFSVTFLTDGIPYGKM
jgi:hypothetical protein